ncbi:MAG TPA: hypothetical protein VG738_14400 [Chitinophagaceae bacterium]|nr:hypothetical protein [Chitinophagaceae bacterium]
MAKQAKRPRDVNQLAKSILDIVTGESEDKIIIQDDISAAASALGKRGGLKGGKARAKVLSPKRRSEIAKKAAAARWNKKN